MWVKKVIGGALVGFSVAIFVTMITGRLIWQRSKPKSDDEPEENVNARPENAKIVYEL
jgi:hypothetical protein